MPKAPTGFRAPESAWARWTAGGGAELWGIPWVYFNGGAEEASLLDGTNLQRFTQRLHRYGNPINFRNVVDIC